MYKKLIIIFIVLFSHVIIGISNKTIMQITLSDSKNGLLQGNHSAKVSVVDHTTNKAYWTERQTIYFSDGFAEIKLGPIDNFHQIDSPRVVLEIDNNFLDFPIYPALFSLHSLNADQLSDTSALFIADGKLGVGTLKPTEKISVDGNLNFLNSANFVQFSNGKKLTGSLLSTISDTLQVNSDSLAIATQNIASMISSINILQIQTGANPIQVNSSLNNALLKIDANGSISPVNNFYIADSNHYFLRTTNQQLEPTKIGSDFKIQNNQLSLNQLNSVILNSTSLTTPSHSSGQLQFYSGHYYMYHSNQWRQIPSTDHRYSMTQFKTSQLSSLDTTDLQGALTFDGSDYYFWKNGWKKLNDYNFSSLSSSESATSFLMVDANGSPYKRTLSANKSLAFTTDGLEIDEQYLSNSTLVFWDQSKFKSVTLGAGFKINNGTLSLDSPIFAKNQAVGIGIEPTETLDVNGALRLRTQSPQSLSNVSVGSIIFDGAYFKGWDGHNWTIFSNGSGSITSNAYWTYIQPHLIANPIGNVGIKVSNPQATLDVSGNVRIRQLPLNQSLNQFLVADSNGDIFSRSIQPSDLFSSSSQIIANGTSLALATMNASAHDLLSFQNNAWTAITISTDANLIFSDSKLSLVTKNVTNGDILVFKNQQWERDSFYDHFNFSTESPLIGHQLIWNGTTWTPSFLSGTNGISVTNNAIGLASNLQWANNMFTIGSDSAASLKVNRLTSTLSSPIKVVDSNDSTLLDINSSGQISIGFNGAHNGYSIASHGFNLFSHSMSRYQSSVGTTNIGASEFGPTLLVHSVPFENASPTRSIIEVLSISGQSRFEIQEGGNVGISTGHPKATLDINGYARLKKYTTEPTVCDVSKDGSIALTSHYKLCVCNGSSWVETSDGTSGCAW